MSEHDDPRPSDPRPTDPFGGTRGGRPEATGPYSAFPVSRHAVAPRRNPWKPAAIVLGSILGLEFVVGVGLVVAAFFAFSEDITTVALDDAVVEQCTDVLEAARAVPLLAGPDESAEPLQALADAADALAGAGRDAAENEADRLWVQDWQRLADALDELAADPTQPFSVPLREGTPVTVPLGLNGPYDCEPPPVITALDPEAPGTLYVDDADF